MTLPATPFVALRSSDLGDAGHPVVAIGIAGAHAILTIALEECDRADGNHIPG